MKNLRIVKISLGCFLSVLVLLTGCCINLGCLMQARYERTVQLSAPLSPGSTFIAETHNGSITMTGGEVSECSLTATIVTRARTDEEAQELSDQVSLTLVPSGDRLTLKIDKPTHLVNKSISVSLDVSVPSKTSLDLLTHNGAVRITDITGHVDATTHNGKTTADNVSGTTILKTHNGEIRCREVSGDTKLETHNGGVDVVYSETASPVCDVSIVTHNGGIDFTSPPGFSAQVNASTHNGHVHTDLPITVTGNVSKSSLKGTIGTGEGTLKLETYNGSIKIK
jgi:hypothetical protein